MAPPPAHPIITKYDRDDLPRQGYKEAVGKWNRGRNLAIAGSAANTSSGMAAAAAGATSGAAFGGGGGGGGGGC